MGPKREKKAPKSTKAAASDPVVSTENMTPAEIAADKLRDMGIVATCALNSKKQHANVRDIAVSNITVTFHGTPLLEETELNLNYGNRYGFIGRNGCGKSTFLNTVAARCFPIPDGIDIFHVKEEIEASDMSAKEAVMSVDTERQRLEAEADMLNDRMADEGENEEVMERLTQVYERLEEMDASTAEARASKILCGLGFTPEKQQKKTREFSGGWRMRIALARALFIQPTLLLLDEPTNHLDMEAVVWLEDYLSKWKKILFLVSHSQDFLNTVCTNIIHFHKKRFDYYGGNYDTFVNTRQELEGEQEKRYKSEQDQIQHMKEYVARFGQGNSKMAKQAQSKEKVLAKMVRGGLTEKVESEKALDFNFPDPGKLSPPVLQCNDITFGYPSCPVLYSHVDFGVDLDSRVALVGPNGAGKSTLLNIMTGVLQPLTGQVRPHSHLRFAKFSQHFVDVLDLEMCPIDYFLSIWKDMTREDARKFLGRFGCSGSVQTQKMEQLSDGQKSRVVFAKMAREAPHLLLLDEPTNHLDMESIDSLAKAINNYSGGMVLVSHDMRLISQVAKEIWVVDNLTVSRYTGEIKDFKMDIRKQMAQQNLIEGNAADIKHAQDTRPKLVPLTANYSTEVVGLSAPAVKVSATSGVSVGGISMRDSKPKEDFPSLGAATAAPVSAEEEQRRARLELAEIAIQKQRARKTGAIVAGGMSAPVVSDIIAPPAVEKPKPPPPPEEREVGAGDPQQENKKEQMREERRRMKEMIAQREAEEEAERAARKLERLQIIAEAERLKEEMAQAKREAVAKKKAEEAAARAAEEAVVQAAIEEAKAKKAAAQARKRARHEARQRQIAAERRALETSVYQDVWTQEQHLALEKALMQYTWIMDRTERWNAITKLIPAAPAPAPEEGSSSSSSDTVAAGTPIRKTRNQCLRRYQYLKNVALHLLRQRAAAAASNSSA